MGSYIPLTDTLGWTPQLLVNSAFVQTALKAIEGRETDSSNSPSIGEPYNQCFFPLQSLPRSWTGQLSCRDTYSE